MKNQSSVWFKIVLSAFIFVFAFTCFSQTSFADTGDFYKENKKAIEKKIKDKDYRDVIKDYDYDTNSFDCGTFDIYCHYKSFVLAPTIGLVKGAYKSLDVAIFKPTDITNNSTFKSYKKGFSALSTSMLVIFLMWQMMKLVAQRFADAEDGFISINDKLLTIVSSAIILGIYDEFFQWALNFQSIAIKSIINDSVSMKDVTLMIILNGGLCGDFIVIILGIAITVFNILFMYRFILFGFLYITGVLAIPTAVNDEYNYFSLWLRLIINNGVTLMLQVLAFTIGFNALIKNNAFDHGASFTTAMGFFMLAIAIPSLLGQMAGQSGTSRAIGSAIRYVARRR